MAQVRPQPGDFSWRKSSYSLANGECIEVAAINDRIAIRDSNSLDHPIVFCPKADWQIFIEMVRRS